MNEKEYLFLSLNSNNIEDNIVLDICQEFQQIHIYSSDNSNYAKIVSLLHLKDKNFYLYCFNEKDYFFALEHNITPHICWLNGNITQQSWIDELVLNCRKEILNYEFFWMISESFVDNISAEEILKINTKLELYRIPVCFNMSNIFNQNDNFIKLQAFIKNIHLNFNNPLYVKEFNSIHSVEGNYYLNSDFNLQKILMGFYGDIINESDIELINIKNMNKCKECLNCELYENCTINKIGYFMHQYNTVKCFGPKLMSFN